MVKRVPRDIVLRINESISFGRVYREDGSLAEDPLSAGCLSSDAKVIWPAGLNWLDLSAGIPIEQFGWSLSEEEIEQWEDSGWPLNA